jgi:hypothetical protein
MAFASTLVPINAVGVVWNGRRVFGDVHVGIDDAPVGIDDAPVGLSDVQAIISDARAWVE